MSTKHFKKDKINGIESRISDKIHLRLTGFDQQDLIPVKEILKNLNTLPDSHLSGLQTIEYDPHRETLLPNFFTRLLQKSSHFCKGVFLQQKRKVVIYEFNSRRMFYHILFHEIGHFVYFLVISPKLKNEWLKETHKTIPFVTDLSKQNAAEDFAECYALYITSPSSLKKSPAKYDFIHHHVFGCEVLTRNEQYYDGVLIDKTF